MEQEAEGGILSNVHIHFVTEAMFSDLPSEDTDHLLLQGFSGEIGQTAIHSASDLHVYVGLGQSLTPRTLTRVIPSALPPIPPGTAVNITGIPDSLLGLTRRALLAAGFRPVGEVDADRVISDAIGQAKEWTNQPGADLYPEAFADEAKRVAASSGLHVDVLDAKNLNVGGFGSLLSVGQGSRFQPLLVDINHSPAHPVATITLVGKGITFDTGGISLKSPASMMGMRMDKAGAAVVLAVLGAVGRLSLPVAVRGLLPLAENMVGPLATRPGDIVTARNGKKVQILDTDFEGRLVMADAIAYAGEKPTDAIIDIATLTYQVAIALGNDVAGLWSNNDDMAAQLTAAADKAGENLWRLPLVDEYRSQVRTPTGVKNHPETDVGRAITAALFLEEFVPAGTSWAHLDCTGPAWSGPASASGATGFGVHTLMEYLTGL